MAARRARLAVAFGCLLALAACTRVVTGSPSGSTLDCARPSATAIVSCLARSLSQYWTAQLGRSEALDVVVDPAADAVPRDCRAALRLDTAFTCPTDNRVYLTRPFVRQMLATGSPGQGWLRIASTLGHEMGHVVQFAVHERLIEKPHPTYADSRAIEQQADCLAGVWARSAGISPRAFTTANTVVLGLVDNARERRSHGTPAARLAALRRGLTGGTPASCNLTVP